jgi:hypothetical protein
VDDNDVYVDRTYDFYYERVAIPDEYLAQAQAYASSEPDYDDVPEVAIKQENLEAMPSPASPAPAQAPATPSGPIGESPVSRKAWPVKEEQVLPKTSTPHAILERALVTSVKSPHSPVSSLPSDKEFIGKFIDYRCDNEIEKTLDLGPHLGITA